MNGKQLKNSILQWAIQGRLVPQDPTDEPASVLLQRIRAEKAKLVKEGKLKKTALSDSTIFRGEDNKYYEKVGKTISCIDEDIPFEIPESWEWCRFGNIMINRDSERIPLSVSQRQSLDKVYDYYGASGVIDKVDKYLFDKDLLLIGEDGANLLYRSTPIAFIAKGKYWVNNHAHVLDACGGLNLPYMSMFINAISLADYITGTAQPKMNQKMMNSILIPLPPLAEQHRIVAKVEEVLSVVERYEKAQDALDSLCNSLDGRLRKSILSEAIQGHLVPQDPTDEPASVLLQRIRAEKAKLVKEGKLKKTALSDSTIFRGEDNKYYEKVGKTITCIDEDIPFEIPETWEWVRLGDISDYNDQKVKIKAQLAPHDTWILDLEDIEKGGKILSVKTIGERKPIGDKTVFRKGQILYSKLRPYLLKILVAPRNGLCTSEIVPFSVYDNISVEYMVTLLKTPYVDSLINCTTYGIKMPRVGTDTMCSLLLPLPPLAEQRRIVAKVEEVFAVLDRLACK